MSAHKGGAISSSEVAVRVVGLCRPFAGQFGLLVALLTASAYLDATIPGLYAKLVDSYSAAGDGDPSAIVSTALTFAGWSVLSMALSMARTYVSADAGESLASSLRSRLHAHLLDLPMGFFTHNKAGELTALFNNQLASAQASLSTALPDIVYQALMVVFTLYRLISLEPRLALAAATVFPLFLVPAVHYGRKLVRLRLAGLAATSDMNDTLVSSFDVDGFAAFKASGSGAVSVSAFDEASQRLADTRVKSRVQHGLFYAALAGCVSVGSGVVLAVTSATMFTQTLSPGKVLAFTGHLNKLIGPLSSLTTVQIQLATAAACFGKVFAYLDVQPESEPDPDTLEALDGFTGHIELVDVSFGYPTAHEVAVAGSAVVPASPARLALRGVSLDIPAGQYVALVGANGAGKTTLVNMVARLYAPTSGTVRYDGRDARVFARHDVAAHIAVLSQDVYLFHDTVAANVAFGASSDASDADIREALDRVGLLDVVEALPKGLDTLVGSRASILSGGQRQRLALARVLLAKPAVLILDEYASHLDTEGEALIGKVLASEFSDTTRIVIAHNPATIARVDRVITLCDGTVVSDHVAVPVGGAG